MLSLFAPDGTRIVSTLEIITGTCDINDAMPITQKEDGTFEFEWAGGTDVDWDSQETVTRDATNGGFVMQRVFIDEDGGEWLEGELVLREPEDV